MELTLLVLAAGMGSRYGGLKQLEPVGPGGEILLDYAVHDARKAGFGRVLFLIRREFEAEFRAAVLARYAGKIAVELAYQQVDRLPGGRIPPPERERPWGTGHAVWCASGHLCGPFAVINADDFYGAGAYAALAAGLRGTDQGRQQPARFCMVGYRLDRTLSEHGEVSRGICALREGSLAGIEETTGIRRGAGGIAGTGEDGTVRQLTGAETVSMNCWGFHPALFPLLEAGLTEFLDQHGTGLKQEFYLPSAVQAMVRAGSAEVRVFESPDAWFGMTYREDRGEVANQLADLVRNGVYPPVLHAEEAF